MALDVVEWVDRRGCTHAGPAVNLNPLIGEINMHKEDTQVLVRALAPLNFGGDLVPFIEYRGKPVVAAREVGERLGYADPTDLADNIAGAWSEDFIEGTDFVRVTGVDLEGIKAHDNPVVHGVVAPRANQVTLLTESGAQMAAMLSRTEKGREFRRWVVDVAIPALRSQMVRARADADVHQWTIGRKRPAEDHVILWREARDLGRTEIAASEAAMKASHVRIKAERLEAQRLRVEVNQKERRELQAGLLRAMRDEIEDWRSGSRKVRTVRGLSERVDTVILDEKACRGATPYLLRDTERRYC